MTRDERSGLSLLEVMLALAILGVSIAAVGELIRIGSISSQRARKSTVAQMLAESRMAELAAGIIPPDPVADMPFEYYEGWTYTIERLELDQEGLVALQLTVQEVTNNAATAESFSLTRWVQLVEDNADVMANETESMEE